jgi:hypothetical protein
MKILLGVLAVALLAVLVLQWRNWPPPEGVAGADAVQPPPKDAASGGRSPMALLDPPVDKEEYAVVTERPLFLPDRRPPTEEPDEGNEDAPADTQETDLARFDLSAVVITPQERTVWVRDPNKPDLLKLRSGDELEGWTVKEIREDELELERQGQTDTLVLRDYEHSAPPAARPPPRPQGPGAQRPVPTGRANPPSRPGARQPQTRLNAKRPSPR